MTLIGNLFTSSIGRKFLMAVSGVILVGFVVGHLVGNLQIFAHPDKINGYAHFLQSLGPVLWLARIGLLVAVAVHIWAAVVLTIENRAARGGTRYGVHHVIRATLVSRTMRWTGIVVLAFIIYHLAQFTLGVAGQDVFSATRDIYPMHDSFHVLGIPVVAKGVVVNDVYSLVFLGFQSPVVSIFYIVAVGLLAAHLLHGVDSMFQTLGWRNHQWSGALRKIAVVFCILYFLGNLIIPGAILTGLAKPAPGTYAADKIDVSR